MDWDRTGETTEDWVGWLFDRGHNIVSGEMDFVGHRNRIKVNKGGKVNATE